MMHQHLAKQIIGAAIELHKCWGPGFYARICRRGFNHTCRLGKPLFNVPLLKQGITSLPLS